MDFAVTTEVDRRAWAVEQAVLAWRAASEMVSQGSRVGDSDPVSLLGLSDQLLAYVSRPIAEEHSKLIDAARSYDGTVNASALIGALADALERR